MKRGALLEYLRLYSRAFRVEQTEPRGVPDLVGEVAIRLDLLLVPTRVGAAHLSQREARRIHSELVEHVDRIDAVHLRLRHALALRVEDCSGNENVGERSFADKLHPHHHHARHPEEDDVARGHQHRRGIESFQILGFVRPTESRERPQRGGEPGVEHVRILRQFVRAGLFARLFFRSGNDHLTVRRVPGGNLVAPPKLSRDGPVAQVLEPVCIYLLVCLRHETWLLFTRHQIEREIAQLVHLHEPLRRDQGLDDSLATLALGDRELVVNHFLQESERFEFLRPLFRAPCSDRVRRSRRRRQQSSSRTDRSRLLEAGCDAGPSHSRLDREQA